ncbi:hypothetical protein GUJ93_ZPchr0004g38454 [Zizania palustris]|uniref:Uncharacterized protein n=1 Tax=Zizania palustris TaxID=103762 RepID=A0A8J5SEJ5_ZIZPA|nr:hypothetical protein GUJ93_ZPchr0004g38454 [Zizania palustris]
MGANVRSARDEWQRHGIWMDGAEAITGRDTSGKGWVTVVDRQGMRGAPARREGHQQELMCFPKRAEKSSDMEIVKKNEGCSESMFVTSLEAQCNAMELEKMIQGFVPVPQELEVRHGIMEDVVSGEKSGSVVLKISSGVEVIPMEKEGQTVVD